MEPVAEDASVKPILEKLASTVVKCFYRPPEVLIVELIIKERVVEEERFQSFLKFDARLVQRSLEVLKNDRIVHRKVASILDSENKTRKVDMYYIKYGELVNVVKYRLEHVRKKVESLERDVSSTKTYVCSSCSKTWSDKEIGELFCPVSFRYRCLICRVDVKGDVSSVPAGSLRLTAKFNEQIGPIYDILQSVEDLLKKQ